MEGRIIRLISNQYQVLLNDGNIVDCIAKGRLRLEERLVCGDFVSVEESHDKHLIASRQARKNYLIRPPIANVDQALIVMSATLPDFSAFLVDQLLFLASFHQIEPILVVTKLDLLHDEEIIEILKEYEDSGYKVILAGKNNDLNPLIKVINNKVSVLTGQSGVGKSTILNRLDPNFALATQEISIALGRGKHTTRHVELHKVKDGWIADTPGFSKLDFSIMSEYDLKEAVLDFREYAPSCRFRDCFHINEPGCAVKHALEKGLIPTRRYIHYQELLEVIKESRKDKYD